MLRSRTGGVETAATTATAAARPSPPTTARYSQVPLARRSAPARSR